MKLKTEVRTNKKNESTTITLQMTALRGGQELTKWKTVNENKNKFRLLKCCISRTCLIQTSASRSTAPTSRSVTRHSRSSRSALRGRRRCSSSALTVRPTRRWITNNYYTLWSGPIGVLHHPAPATYHSSITNYYSQLLFTTHCSCLLDAEWC